MNNNQTTNFTDLGIAPRLLEILEKNKFSTPTPIQQQSIPHGILGKDLMGIAQTGTGKTLAFGIPMIQRLAQSQGKIKGLVVLPTRELALQVEETYKKIGGPIGLKTALLIGGESMHKQIKQLKANPHVIIATPGRLIDHLESKSVKLEQTKIVVLDEADRMLDMGFAPQIKRILDQVPRERQTMLFSATMPEEIVKIANGYMQTPLRVEVAPAGTSVQSITQEIFFVDRAEKLSLLKNVLEKFNGSILVFARTKFGAKKIAKAIRDFGITSTEIHSNKSLNQRLEALKGFKLGTYRVMVATDIAARGIDVTGIQLVVNFDLPQTAEDYVHRIGRTGRAQSTGHAISFATPDQKRDIRDIERLIKKALPVSETPTLQRIPMGHVPEKPERSFRSPERRSSGQFRSPTNDKPRFNSPPKRKSSSRPFGHTKPPRKHLEDFKWGSFNN